MDRLSARFEDTEVIRNLDGRSVTMNHEEKKKPVNITREELYQQVWTTSMSRLGAQYGVSGNGLKKICVRLNVPYLPRGYWAKLGAGINDARTVARASHKLLGVVDRI
jgi:hypothetical protein